MAMQVVWLTFSLLVLLSLGINGESYKDKILSCPTGWKTFTSKSGTVDCLWVSPSPISYQSRAKSHCNNRDAALVSVLSKEKYNFVIRLMTDGHFRSIWTGLDKYWDGFKWRTWDSRESVTFSEVTNFTGGNCGVIDFDRDGFFTESYCDQRSRGYICEKRPACKPGLYGKACELQCHCEGQPCDSSKHLYNIKCPSGCQPGWRGDTCKDECQPGRYGYQCMSECHCNGQPCDAHQVNVTCPSGCKPGWMGPACNTSCYDGWYGDQCKNQCHCQGQPCDSTQVNVTCPFGCEPGWLGAACNKPCKPGWYGDQCKKTCHCHGQPCDASNWKVLTCLYGCQPGWKGRACDTPMKKAEGTYYCVDPIYKEKRVTILIDTKGTKYRAIEAIDEDNKVLPWCKFTEITHNDQDNSVTIKIPMGCAGQETGNQTYKWRISIKEWKGIRMPMDGIIEVHCDFNNAESLSRPGDPVITENLPVIPVSPLKISEVKSITVKLLDTATKKQLNSSSIGDPVFLQIQYNLKAGSKVKSISPHSCIATSDDGKQRIRLLDLNGCQVQGSPVQPFAKTSQPNTLETPWFLYFAFKASDSVVFRCSFVFCFDYDCHVGCYRSLSWPIRGRHVRSTRDDFTHQAEDHVGVSK